MLQTAPDIGRQSTSFYFENFLKGNALALNFAETAATLRLPCPLLLIDALPVSSHVIYKKNVTMVLAYFDHGQKAEIESYCQTIAAFFPFHMHLRRQRLLPGFKFHFFLPIEPRSNCCWTLPETKQTASSKFYLSGETRDKAKSITRYLFLYNFSCFPSTEILLITLFVTGFLSQSPLLLLFCLETPGDRCFADIRVKWSSVFFWPSSLLFKWLSRALFPSFRII